MQRPTCRTCPHFAWHFDDGFPVSVLVDLVVPMMPDEMGECRRRSPSIPGTREQALYDSPDSDEDGHLFLGIWPMVDNREGCGEHPDFPAYAAAFVKALAGQM